MAKSTSILNEKDLSIKRLIEIHPATVADIAHVLQLTSQQVRASLEKLVQRNDVFPVLHTDKTGRRNIYFAYSVDTLETIRSEHKHLRDWLGNRWVEAETLDDKLVLLHRLDKAFSTLYNGAATQLYRRRVSE